jgi:hypothetical protein
LSGQLSVLENGVLAEIEHGKARLSTARNFYLEEWRQTRGLDVDLDGLVGYFERWVNFHEYLLLLKVFSHGNQTDRSFVAVKCSKRGNDVYLDRVNRRLGKLSTENLVFFDHHANMKKTPMLFVVLSFDPQHASLAHAWEDLGKDWNRWITNLRQKYGRISMFRTWESFENGYPHINAILYFHDHSFEVAFSQMKTTRGGRLKRVYRVHGKEVFEHGYHSFVDVQGVRTLNDAMRYVSKDITKSYQMNQGSESDVRKQILTLALCWIFRKRSYSFGGGRRSEDGRMLEKGFFDDLIRHLHNSKKVQLDLDGHVVAWTVMWVLLKGKDGSTTWSGGVLGLRGHVWTRVWDGRPPFYGAIDWSSVLNGRGV